jgi:hypothetical protein
LAIRDFLNQSEQATMRGVATRIGLLQRHEVGEGVDSITITVCTVSFNIPKFYILPTMCLYVKYVSQNQQRTFFPIHHSMTGFYN